MNAARWREVEALFHRALELPAQERAAFLATTCDSEDLRRDVAAMLAADEGARSFLEEPAIAAAAAAAAGHDGPRANSPAMPTQVGPYRLLRKIGEGGMSVVFLGVRADAEYERQVAVKLMRRGFDGGEALNRFRVERQILASLDHPSIARLLDGGTTDDGQPYFVMEYLEGEAIDAYCDRRRLTVRERLALMRPVCAAVQYAHQRLVVHRDIKPSNILVPADGVPRLLDFGIAKLLDPTQFPETVERTSTGLRLMTPNYASPEQVRGGVIATTTDVYALGVLLYKLVTGRLPYRANGSTTALEQAVLHEEPERPSAAIFRAVEGGPSPEELSRSRGEKPAQLRRQLAGDIDDIVLMAIRKEPERRYASVEQLDADIQRHLTGLPVHSRHGTVVYRAGKFLRRNRVAVAAGALLLAVVVGFSATTMVQSRHIARERDQAERERDKARRVIAFLEDLFQIVDPGQARGAQVTARELLDRGATTVGQELEREPEVAAALLDTIGVVYTNLGLPASAEPLLERAVALRRRAHGDEDVEVAQSLNHLGVAQRTAAEFAAAETTLRRALALRRKLLGPEHVDVADTLHNLGAALIEEGKLKEAGAALDEALRILRKGAADDERVATVRNERGELSLADGDFAGAEADFRESLRLYRRRFGEPDPRVALLLSNLGSTLGMVGKTEAEAPLRDALAMRLKLYGDVSSVVAESTNNLATFYKTQGRPAEAVPLFESAIAIDRKLGDDHPRLATILNNLALLKMQMGDPAGAEPLFQEALRLRRKLLGEKHPDVGVTLMGLGTLLMERGDPKAAEPLLAQALAIFQAAFPAGHFRIAQAQNTLGACLGRLGRTAEAEPLLVGGYETLAAKEGPATEHTVAALQRLVAFYRALGDDAKSARYQALLPPPPQK